MHVLERLMCCEGKWQGKNTLQDPHTNKPETSDSIATVVPMLNGRFVRVDYTWGYQGKPQEGSLLIGFEKNEDQVTAHWIDTWHYNEKVMACAGPNPKGNTLSVRGTYPAPPGPDWGWRIDLTPADTGELQIVMFNIFPDGKEELAVEAFYQRIES
jgi:hypothetical protein